LEEVLEKAKKDNKKDKFDITIIYNGVEKKLKVETTDTVKHVLDRAIQIFNAQQPHLLALWTESGQEITNETQTVKDAGIHEDDKLILRPSQVRGG
jgi:hypothetical protein